jgi:hypothetical protein
MVDLDRVKMFVSSTAANGVVSGETCLDFSQRGERVWARYSGGKVSRGWLVGRWIANSLRFRYVQIEELRTIHAGRSTCDVQRLSDGRLRLIEHFAWSTRSGSGINIFDELGDSHG